MSKNVYLVPHDFTAVGDAALRYALFLGKRVNTEIILLNLTTSKGESIKASMKFDDLIDRFFCPSVKEKLANSFTIICNLLVTKTK